MRKHFLLFVLMALLPLVGFAETDISEFDFRINAITFEYTGATPDITSQVQSTDLIAPELTLGSEYNLVYFDKDDNPIEVANVVNVGTYKVAAKGTGLYMGTTSKITFNITEVDLAGLAISVSALTYTECRATNPTKATYDGKTWNPTATLTWTTPNPDYVLVENTDYTVSYGANINAGTNAGSIIFTAKAGGNYKGTRTVTFDIAKIGIPDGKVTAPTAKTGLKYSAEEQELVAAGAVDTEDGEDYGKIQYSLDGTTWTTSIPTAKNACVSGYTVYWKVVGGTNYNDVPYTAISGIAIAKGQITIIPVKKTKTYDGAAFTDADVKYSVAGRVGEDATEEVSGIGYTVSPAFAATQGTYTVTADGSSAKIGTVDMSTNYDVTPQSAKFTINKANLSIEVTDFKMTYGAPSWPTLPTSEEDKEEVLTFTGAVDSEVSTMLGNLTFEMATGSEEALYGKTPNSIEVNSYENAIKVSKGSAAVWDNYNVEETYFGTLKVNGAEFNIMPVFVTTIEYGDEYTIDYWTSDDATIDENTLTFVIGEDEYAYSDKANWELPTELGNYPVTIKEGVKGNGNNLGSVVNRQQNSYKIVAKKINITVKSQTALKGDVAQDFLDKLGEEAVTIPDLPYGDNYESLNVKFAFVDSKVTVTDEKIADSAGDISDAITLTINNNNYAATVTPGQLTVSESYSTTLNNDGTAYVEIKKAAANGSPYSVTIVDGTRTLAEEKWSMIVLPFAISPIDFCTAIDKYAVFNRLSSATGNSVKFALELNEIPANEPFLVKPSADVDFTSGVTFEDVVVKENGESPVFTKDDATITGTYNATLPIVETSFYAVQQGEFVPFTDVTSGTKAIGFTRAYLTLDNGSSSARFFVEDIDSNGATAIKEINVETMQSIENGNLYNLNGMKMQGAPVKKGIYIQNGKKVVVK